MMDDIVYVPCEKSHMFCKKCFNDSLEKRGPRCPACDVPIPRQKEFPIPDKKRYIQNMLLICTTQVV